MLTELCVLLAFKAARAILLSYTHDFLFVNGLSISILTFAVLALTAIILVPSTNATDLFSGPTRIAKGPVIFTYSMAYAFSTFLLFKGLTYLSPIRVSMLFEQGELWQLGFVTVLKLASKKTGLLDQSHLVGIGLSTFAFFLALVIDFTQHTGYTVSERGFGYICVVSSVWLSAFQKNVIGQKISREAHGMKLLAVASAFGALGISPIAAFEYLTSSDSGIPHSWNSLGLFVGLSLVFVIGNQYVNTIGGVSMKAHTRIILGWGFSVIVTLMYSSFLFAAFARFSLEVALLLLYGIGFYYLLKADPSLPFKMGITSKQHSSILLPTHDGLFMTTTEKPFGVLNEAGSYIRIILENQDSRQIFYFLLLNLSYMFVQMIYGVWTNSLGLISDAIHMFFDCLALGVGLFASVMSKWPANKTFSYGYSRIETLSGFSNGIFLVLISIFIVIEAIERLIHPPEMNTHRLLLVSFVGFLVNLIGIFAFNHGHAHGHSHGHDHCGGGGGGGDHGHDHHGHNANMQGVFLHIMADTLGSVGVIISTLLIEQFGWTGFDPIASIFIAVLIFLSVIPLIRSSMSILMLESSGSTVHSLEHLLPQIMNVPGVQSYSSVRFWANDSESTVGTLHLTIVDEADEERIRQQVKSLVKQTIPDLKELCIQIEKLYGFNHCLCKAEIHSQEQAQAQTYTYSNSYH
ncbi:hypothetical protein K7432_006950 [Basidiobolus ranarum]|uniref:Uncharacterized protein n=1 Tax=Basidiobolus ranarum TaxID=34480 RepID=A0ABR2WU53_9FUNG